MCLDTHSPSPFVLYTEHPSASGLGKEWKGDERVRDRLSETHHASIRPSFGGEGDRSYWSGVIAPFVCFYAVAENNHGATNRVENLPRYVVFGSIRVMVCRLLRRVHSSTSPSRLKTVRGEEGKEGHDCCKFQGGILCFVFAFVILDICTHTQVFSSVSWWDLRNQTWGRFCVSVS